MNEDKLQALLSGYAAGTLTSDEQAELFAKALERQDVFDALLREQTLRETLDDPQIRSQLLSQVQPPRKQMWPTWGFGGLKWAASVAAVLLVAGITFDVWQKQQQGKTRQLEEQMQAPQAPAAIWETGPQTGTEPKPKQSHQKLTTDQDKQLAERGSPAKPALPQRLPEAPTIAQEAQYQASNADIFWPANPAPPPPPTPVSQSKGFVAGAADSGGGRADEAVRVSASAPAISATGSTRAGQPSSPRLLFQSQQKPTIQVVTGAAGMLRGGTLGVVGAPLGNAKAKAMKPPVPENAAIRVALHLPGQASDVDWRAVSPFLTTRESQTLVIQVDTVAAGHIAILETPAGGLDQTLAPGSILTLARNSIRVPLAVPTGQQQITVVYSPTALTPDRITQILKATFSPIEETHSGPEHALYAGAAGPAQELVVRFAINLH
jgi:hypothetical protein